MGLFGNLFKRKSATRTEMGLSQLTKEIKSHKQETNQHMQLINQMLRTIDTRQKETVLQLDDLSNQLQENTGEHDLALALISAIDIIEDFYRLTISDPALLAQSQMMWSAAMKAATAGGLEVIDDHDIPPDFKRHRIEGTESDPAVQNGCITKTLKCGYLYKGEILRTAKVLVQKEAE